MAFFPRIQSPCPYKGNLAAVMDGDFCRMCERQVFDLSHMSGDEKRAFLAGCAGEVCISYRFSPAIAAAALAAAMPAAAAAQDLAPIVPDAAAMAATTAELAATDENMEIIVGGIKDPRNVQYVEDPAAPDAPDLPVVYEEAPARQSAPGPAPRPATGG